MKIKLFFKIPFFEINKTDNTQILKIFNMPIFKYQIRKNKNVYYSFLGIPIIKIKEKKIYLK